MEIQDKIIIPNPEELEKKKAEFKREGKNNIHILSSFDKTLTKATFNGKKIVSFIAKLRNGNYISKDYAQKAQEIFNKYHPLEMSKEISQEEKNKAMLEWWKTHYELLITSGLNQSVINKIIEDMIKDKDITLREGTSEFLRLTKDENIPLVILTASGLGNAMVSFLEKTNINYKNLNFIGNTLEFDSGGNFKGIKDNKIIHTFNKNHSGLKDLPIYKELEKRKNVILMCDSIADLNMINGFHFKNLIKIAFYNDNEQSLEDFKNKFDMIILNDGSFEPVNQILQDILN